MTYPCNMIQDLLPLYLDGVCSEESKMIIEQHLSTCSTCKKYYEAMCKAEESTIMPPAPEEVQKAASFRSIRKKILHKQLLIAGASFVVIAFIIFAAIGILKSSVNVVEYQDNLSVSMVDGSLIGRLKGSQESYLKIIRTTTETDAGEKNYLFYYVSDTQWDALTTSSQVFSEYTLCPSDKGADQIDGVYYYTGDYTGIEDMDSSELQTVINKSLLLWSK